MLKIRLIPTLLLKSGRMIKTIKFDAERDVGDPVSAAKIYNAQNVDELAFLDITASRERHQILYEMINKVSKECFMPLAVGGGVGELEDIRHLLLAGADKVIINTAAVERPEFISEAAGRFGSQCIIVSIDARREAGGNFRVFTEGGRRLTGREAGEWARQAERLGAGEVLLTSIDRDGTMIGYEIDLIKHVSEKISIPAIASGGAGNLQDLVDVAKAGAAAVAAASLFHFTDQSPIKARSFMRNAGLEVRFV